MHANVSGDTLKDVAWMLWSSTLVARKMTEGADGEKRGRERRGERKPPPLSPTCPNQFLTQSVISK